MCLHGPFVAVSEAYIQEMIRMGIFAYALRANYTGQTCEIPVR